MQLLNHGNKFNVVPVRVTSSGRVKRTTWSPHLMGLEYEFELRKRKGEKSPTTFGELERQRARNISRIPKIYDGLLGNFGCELAEGSPLFTLKRDGSIDGLLGAELVMQPMRLESFHSDYIMQMLNYICRYADDNTTNKRCGVHISIPRDHFNAAEHRQLMLFFLVNKPLIEYIAGRKENRWASFSTVQEALFSKRLPHEHSSALNFSTLRECYDEDEDGEECYQTIDEGRIEIRVFNGTNKISQLLTYLEFVDALTHTLKTWSTGSRQQIMSIGDLLGTIAQDHGRYENLSRKLSKTSLGELALPPTPKLENWWAGYCRRHSITGPYRTRRRQTATEATNG